MPELPEVETILRGLMPTIQDSIIENVIIRCLRLRWPIPDLQKLIARQAIVKLSRRGKYLLLHLTNGTLIIHLGMSGQLCLLTDNVPPKKHDHVDFILNNNCILRYTDPRRFGAILWTPNCPLQHPLLKTLGVEPLTEEFTADYLLKFANNRRVAIKPFIMNSHIVVGVGNIYATEALFLAGIHPATPAGRVTCEQALKLVTAIKKILTFAITQGGTTLKDYVNSQGQPGYFAQQLQVYARGGLPCMQCQTELQSYNLGQRSTVFCPQCQMDLS